MAKAGHARPEPTDIVKPEAKEADRRAMPVEPRIAQLLPADSSFDGRSDHGVGVDGAHALADRLENCGANRLGGVEEVVEPLAGY